MTTPDDIKRTAEECAFCLMFKDGQDIIDIEPLNPVTYGHRLIIPRQHVSNFSDDPDVSAEVMRYAAEYAKRHGIDCNLITSKGSPATQTVFHLHVHIVPRREGDGLLLPWSGQTILSSRDQGYQEGVGDAVKAVEKDNCGQFWQEAHAKELSSLKDKLKPKEKGV